MSNVEREVFHSRLQGRIRALAKEGLIGKEIALALRREGFLTITGRQWNWCSLNSYLFQNGISLIKLRRGGS